MKKYIGGVVYKNSNGQSIIEFIKSLLTSKQVEITTISYMSLYSVVFLLDIQKYIDVPGNKSPFFGLNNDGTEYSLPIHTLALKVSVINKITKGYFAGWEKKTVTMDDFTREYKTQRTIYDRTKIKGKPLCFSLIDSMVINNTESNSFITDKLIPNSVDNAGCLQGFLKETQEDSKSSLGIIIMEYGDGYIASINPFLVKAIGIKPEKKGDLIQETLSLFYFSALRLYCEAKILNKDFHSGNIMFKLLSNGDIDARIIDFGQVDELVGTPDLSSLTNFAITFKVLEDVMKMNDNALGNTGNQFSFKETWNSPSFTNKELIQRMLDAYNKRPDRVLEVKDISPNFLPAAGGGTDSQQPELPPVPSAAPEPMPPAAPEPMPPAAPEPMPPAAPEPMPPAEPEPMTPAAPEPMPPAAPEPMPPAAPDPELAAVISAVSTVPQQVSPEPELLPAAPQRDFLQESVTSGAGGEVYTEGDVVMFKNLYIGEIQNFHFPDTVRHDIKLLYSVYNKAILVNKKIYKDAESKNIITKITESQYNMLINKDADIKNEITNLPPSTDHYDMRDKVILFLFQKGDIIKKNSNGSYNIKDYPDGRIFENVPSSAIINKTSGGKVHRKTKKTKKTKKSKTKKSKKISNKNKRKINTKKRY
jgi:hypothetical protein